MNIEQEIEKRANEINKVKRRLFVIKCISNSKKSVIRECEEFGVPRSSFYEWRKRYESEGEHGLKRKKPIAINHPNKIPPKVIDKILELRITYQLGSIRISWYLERYHGINVSESSVYRILVRNGLNRLPKTASKRTVHTKRYAKKVPGHQVQVDVKFATFNDSSGNKIRRYQFTAIDDATRIRALKMYKKHNQTSAIDFIDYVIEKFPFRLHTIRTDRGHEFQARFHWHVEDKGMRHVYIKPRSPQLNGKVERSHRTDQEEFYQLLSYTDDVDLNEKLEAWENFYNFNRPHGAFDGKTPYEALKCTLENTDFVR
ncbi:IS481 family transposase [Bacteroidota bacterium]